jgi:hypothetical protein
MVYQLQMAGLWSIIGPRTNLIYIKCCLFNGEMDNVFGLWSKTYFDDFRSVQNFSVNTRIYECKLLNMLFQLLMAIFWSILGPRTNLMDGKCSKFNGEIDNVFSLGSKI